MPSPAPLTFPAGQAELPGSGGNGGAPAVRKEIGPAEAAAGGDRDLPQGWQVDDPVSDGKPEAARLPRPESRDGGVRGKVPGIAGLLPVPFLSRIRHSAAQSPKPGNASRASTTPGRLAWAA